MAIMYKPSVQDLDSLKNEAMRGGSVPPSEWLKKMADGYASILRKNPLQYRSFGPFWWLVKRELINHGYGVFGQTVDLEWFEHADYGDPVLNILAAWAYSEFAEGQGLLLSARHPVTFLSDGEPEQFEYVLVDEEVEILTV